MFRSKLWVLLVVAITFAVYAPSLANGFTYDDADVVRVPSRDGGANELIGDLKPLGVYFTTSYSTSHGGVGRGFRPITVLSFALVHRLARTERPSEPGGPLAPAMPHHLVNIVFHCVATWLTFEILVLFLGAGLAPLLGAAVFGLHALRSDPVISLVGRAEVMAYAFGAASLLLYVAGLRRRGGARFVRLGLAAIAFFLSVGSKESAAPWVVFAPLVVMALRWQHGAESGFPNLRGQVVPWLLAFALPFAIFFAMLLDIWVDLAGEFEPAYESNPLWFEPGRFFSAVMILGYGLYKVFLPIHLAHDYSAEVFELASGAGDYRFLASFAVLAGALVAGVRGATRRPLVFLAVAVFFGFTFLTSNIAFGIETIFGERLYYTPAAGLSLVVAALVHRLDARGVARNVVLGVLGLWLAGSCVLIVGRDFDWKDNKTLFFADAETQPDSIRIQMTLMQYLRGDPERWKRAIDHAHSINPEAPAPLRELAVFHNTFGQFAEAEKYARRGLATKHRDLPTHEQAIHLELARALEGQNRLAEAEQEIRNAIRIAEADPRHPDVRKRLALADFFLRTGKVDAAKREYRTVIRKDAQCLPAWGQLLFVLQDERKDGEIRAMLAQAERYFPRAPELGLHLAMLQQRTGDGESAARIFDEAIRYVQPGPLTARYFEFYAGLLVNQRRVDQARNVVLQFLRMPGLPRDVFARFERLAQQLGMRRRG